jgi:hypothetical protein
VTATTIVWLAATMLTAPEDREVLLAFYRRVKPSASLWGPVAREASDVQPRRDGLFNLLDWVAGCAMIYLALFGVGKIIFGQTLLGVGLLAGGAFCGAVIYLDLDRRGWKTVLE